MKTFSVLGLMVVLGSGAAAADVTVRAQLCNKTDKPVEFHPFNHNDMASGLAPLSTKMVRPCSCVSQQTLTDLWHNFPIARINQLVYREVSSKTSVSIKVCVDAKGKFEGYVDGNVKTCAEAKKDTKYLPAPELTKALGDLVILQSHLHVDSSDCKQKDWTNGCVEYEVTFSYADGAECYGAE